MSIQNQVLSARSRYRKGYRHDNDGNVKYRECFRENDTMTVSLKNRDSNIMIKSKEEDYAPDIRILETCTTDFKEVDFFERKNEFVKIIKSMCNSCRVKRLI